MDVLLAMWLLENAPPPAVTGELLLTEGDCVQRQPVLSSVLLENVLCGQGCVDQGEGPSTATVTIVRRRPLR